MSDILVDILVFYHKIITCHINVVIRNPILPHSQLVCTITSQLNLNTMLYSPQFMANHELELPL